MKQKFHKSTSETGWSFYKEPPKGYKLYDVFIEGKKTSNPKPIYYFEKKNKR